MVAFFPQPDGEIGMYGDLYFFHKTLPAMGIPYQKDKGFYVAPKGKFQESTESTGDTVTDCVNCPAGSYLNYPGAPASVDQQRRCAPRARVGAQPAGARREQLATSRHLVSRRDE